MACFLRPLPRPCWRLPPITSTWAHSSVFLRCCIPGDRHSSTIRTSIVSYLAVDSRLTIYVGSVAGKGSFCQSKCSAVYSAGSFLLILVMRTSKAGSFFTDDWSTYHREVRL